MTSLLKNLQSIISKALILIFLGASISACTPGEKGSDATESAVEEASESDEHPSSESESDEHPTAPASGEEHPAADSTKTEGEHPTSADEDSDEHPKN